MIRLSVIIPMFNVAPFVGKCIKSIEDQDIPKADYEIICINDGSDDNSNEIIASLQKKFVNIRLLDQENQGVSRARNKGIENAKGEYILFIDADDFIEKNRLESILDIAIKNRAQVSFLGYTILNEDNTFRKQELYDSQLYGLLNGMEAYRITHSIGKTNPDSSCAILYERKFINQHTLRFLPEVPYLEDGEFISRVLCLADRCVFHDQSFYYRTSRTGSATNTSLFFSKRARDGFLLAAENLKNFQNMGSLKEGQRMFLNQPICKYVVLSISSANKPFRLRRFSSVQKWLKSHGMRRIDLRSVNSEYTKLGYYYNLSPYLLLLYLNYSKRLNSIRYRVRKLIAN